MINTTQHPHQHYPPQEESSNEMSCPECPVFTLVLEALYNSLGLSTNAHLGQGHWEAGWWEVQRGGAPTSDGWADRGPTVTTATTATIITARK